MGGTGLPAATTPRRLDHPRIARKVLENGGRYYHVINIKSPDQIDDDVKRWLTEAWGLDSD